jgi:hypothetical protein
MYHVHRATSAFLIRIIFSECEFSIVAEYMRILFKILRWWLLMDDVRDGRSVSRENKCI